MADPPSPSRRPRTDRSLDSNLDEPKTDPGFQVNALYLWNKLEEQGAALESTLKKHDNKLTFRSVVVAVAAVATGVTAALIFIDNRVAAQTDAGVKVHEQRIVTLEQNAKEDREKTVHETKRINKKVDRLEDKLDLLLDKANVPQSKRPAKDDEP